MACLSFGKLDKFLLFGCVGWFFLFSCALGYFCVSEFWKQNKQQQAAIIKKAGWAKSGFFYHESSFLRRKAHQTAMIPIACMRDRKYLPETDFCWPTEVDMMIQCLSLLLLQGCVFFGIRNARQQGFRLISSATGIIKHSWRKALALHLFLDGRDPNNNS